MRLVPLHRRDANEHRAEIRRGTEQQSSVDQLALELFGNPTFRLNSTTVLRRQRSDTLGW